MSAFWLSRQWTDRPQRIVSERTSSVRSIWLTATSLVEMKQTKKNKKKISETKRRPKGQNWRHTSTHFCGCVISVWHSRELTREKTRPSEIAAAPAAVDSFTWKNTTSVRHLHTLKFIIMTEKLSVGMCVCTAGFRRSRFPPSGRPHQKEADRRFNFFFDARNVDQLSQGTTWLASDVVAVPTHLPQSDQSRSRDFYLQRCRSWKFSPVPKRSGTFWSLVIIVKGRPIVRAPRTKCARRLCQKCKLCCLQKCKLLKISDVSSRYRLFRTPFPGLLIRISEWNFHQ